MVFVEYPDGYENYVIDEELVTLHKIKLTGLKRNTLYMYLVVSCNNDTCLISDAYNFTTANINKESNALKIDNLRIINEYAKPGEEVETSIRIQNNHNEELKNIRVTVIFPEIGLRERIGPFDVNDDDEVNKQIRIALPDDVQPGEYIARIFITGNDCQMRRVKHRYITVT